MGDYLEENEIIEAKECTSLTVQLQSKVIEVEDKDEEIEKIK